MVRRFLRLRTMEMTVSKKISFEAAHFLPDYPGKCANLHGHHWVVELGVTGEVDKSTGMVVDFSVLKDILESIRRGFDHTCLNDFPFFEEVSPTAENICGYIEGRVHAPLSHIEGVKLEFIRVWETEDSMVELRR